jgi:VIT1/CCC1 family predicted Fe2+/Mn2+ transporter
MSNFLNLNSQDLLKGFIVAFLSAALTGVVATLDSGVLPTLAELKSAAIVGLTAGLSYLLKNLLTNSQGVVLKKD